MPVHNDPNVIVGFNGADDAGVYDLGDGRYLIQTVDFFTPVVDDPYDYGMIAAANSLSDVYAMGGEPLCAMGIVAWPIGKYGPEMMGEILRGGYEKALEAGIPVIGGHSIDDAEPKFGLSVSGIVKKENLLTNAGAKPGDVLLLTKPLGSGIYTTAIKQEKASSQQIRVVTEVMGMLNRSACQAMNEVGVNSCTDISGYGLLGHLNEMLTASGTSAIINVNQIPFLPDLEDLALKGAIPGGTINNLHHADSFTDWSSEFGELGKMTIVDAQTSGGLLISCPKNKLQELQLTFKAKGVRAPVIGVVFDGPAGAVIVSP